MQTAYNIDILARIGIISLLPLGLHMGHLWGVQPFGGGFLVAVWLLAIGWLTLCISSYVYRETDRGIQLTLWDERVRFILIPIMVITSISSLMGYGPFNVGPMQYWFSIKILLYSVTLMIGLKLRFIMREWTTLFRVLAEGPNQAAEDQLEKSLVVGKRLAYCYWVTIASVAFFGATKAI